MNCKKVQERIDEMIFNSGTHPDQNIQSHMDTCENCSSYYQEALKERELMKGISDLEPVLSDPKGLTDSIMQSIAQDEQANKKQRLNFRLITRLLAAAVVALVLTLGIEQYTVLNKILILESELGAQKQSDFSNKNLIYQANMLDISLLTNTDKITFSMKKIKALMWFNRIKHLNFTYSDINRYMNEDKFSKNQLNKQLIQDNE